MINTVHLTLEEYDRLKEVQIEATTLVEQTNTNLKQKLDVANSKIAELEADLRKYAIGGARMKPELEYDPEQEMPPISEVEQIIQLIANDEPTNKGKWSKVDDEYIVTIVGENMEVYEVAEHLNRSKPSIRSRARHLGYKIKHDRIVS